jgi:hypothetical protein
MDASMASGGGTDLGPRGIGDIVSASFEIYKAHWQRLMTIAAIVLVPLYFVSDLIVWLATKNATASISTTSVNGQITSISVNSTAVWAGALAGFVALAIGVLAGFILQAAIARGAATAVVGDVGVDEAYQYGFKRLGSFIWIAILVGAIVGLVPFLVMIALTLLISGLFIIWLLAFLVAIFFIGTMLSLTIPSLVVENKRGMEALSRSWELVKEHFWHVFGAFFVAELIAGVVGGVIHAVFGFGGWFVRFIGDSIAGIITMPFVAIVIVVVYLDVRSRKDNLNKDGLRAELQNSGP